MPSLYQHFLITTEKTYKTLTFHLHCPNYKITFQKSIVLIKPIRIKYKMLAFSASFKKKKSDIWNLFLIQHFESKEMSLCEL